MLGNSCPGLTLAKVAGEQCGFGCCRLSTGLKPIDSRFVGKPSFTDWVRVARESGLSTYPRLG
jgi:hypothetical protein